MTFAQRRFAYYLGINVAIIVAYVSVMFVGLFKKRANQIKLALALCVIIVVPSIRMDISMADYGRMNKDWQQCTRWLYIQRDSQNREVMKQLHIGTYDETLFLNHRDYYYTGKLWDYGVLTWWDYGNWVIVAGHTPASCTPIDQDLNNQGQASQIFTKTDVNKAITKLKELQLKYVIVTDEMFKDKLYPILKTANVDIDSVVLEDLFMYRLFYLDNVESCRKVWGTEKVKIFEVK
jgi:dolichyl-diphosphooligosaccharide--protein glycosyltransferase